MAVLRDKTQYINDMRKKAPNWPKDSKFVTGSWMGDLMLEARSKEFTKVELAALEAETSDLGKALKKIKQKPDIKPGLIKGR